MRIDFVSDVACPWCALGLHSLERALKKLGPEIPVNIHLQPQGPNCGGELKIIEAILKRSVTEKILTHLGLQARAPPRAPARGQALLPCSGRRQEGKKGPFEKTYPLLDANSRSVFAPQESR